MSKHQQIQYTARLGGNTFINVPDLVIYKGRSMFSLRRGDDGILLIGFDVLDRQGKHVARFANSIVVNGDSSAYEITTGHDAYSVTERSTGRVIARVQRRGVHGAELDVHVRMYLPDGRLLEAGPDATNFGGLKISGSTFHNTGCAINII
jgi:hypothetical protein